MRQRDQLYPVELSEQERKELQELTRKGQLNARVYKRAQTLLCADQGLSDSEIVKAIGVSNPTVKRVRKTFVEAGLKAVLEELPRSGRPSIFDGKTRAKITALACSEAPEGYSQWSLRLLADKAVELKLVDKVSHTQMGHILKKTNSHLTSKGSGVSPS
jgi:putative transposase